MGCAGIIGCRCPAVDGVSVQLEVWGADSVTAVLIEGEVASGCASASVHNGSGLFQVRSMCFSFGPRSGRCVQVEPSDVLALALVIRLAVNAATSCASYKPQKAVGAKAMAGVLLAGGVAAISEQVLPAVTALVGDVVSSLGVDGGGAAGGECRSKWFSGSAQLSHSFEESLASSCRLCVCADGVREQGCLAGLPLLVLTAFWNNWRRCLRPRQAGPSSMPEPQTLEEQVTQQCLHPEYPAMRLHGNTGLEVREVATRRQRHFTSVVQ